MGQFQKQREIKAPSDQRRECECPPRRRTELCQLPVHGVLYAVRHMQVGRGFSFPASIAIKNFARSDQGLQHFLNEEGVALSEALEHVEESSLNVLVNVEDRAHHLLNLLARQRRKRDLV